MNIALPPFNRRVLLTGAGFSKNYGGFLANEFNDRLLSKPEIRYRGKLHDLVAYEANFEAALIAAREASEKGDGKLARADAKLLEQIIIQIFVDQDNVMARSPDRHDRSINVYRLQEFLNRFTGKNPRLAGFFFTLNQDLLIERKHYNHLGFPEPNEPGVTSSAPYFSASMSSLATENQRSLVMIDDTEERAVNLNLFDHLNYIKLHGSFNWRTARGSELLIIGGNKGQAINQSPLLRSYLDIFDQVCSAGWTRLLTIGYSFCDEHVNEIICLAMLNHSLEIWVWDVVSRQEWIDRLQRNERLKTFGNIMLDQMRGYIQGPLSEYFVPAERPTSPLDARIEEFFDSPGLDSQVVLAPRPF